MPAIPLIVLTALLITAMPILAVSPKMGLVPRVGALASLSP